MRYARANSILGGELVAPFRRSRGGPGGCWIVGAPELHLGRRHRGAGPGGLKARNDARFSGCAISNHCARLGLRGVLAFDPSDRSEREAKYQRPRTRCTSLVRGIRCEEAGRIALFDGRSALLVTLADDAPVGLPPFDAINFTLDALWPGSTAADGGATGHGVDDLTDQPELCLRGWCSPCACCTVPPSRCAVPGCMYSCSVWSQIAGMC